MGIFEKFKDLGDADDDDLSIPTAAWISLARRGMEQISLEQCFLPNCDNEDPKEIERLDRQDIEDNENKTTIISYKCKDCNRIFKLKYVTIKKVAKPTKPLKSADEEALSMGMVYALDEDDKNLGHIGYF
ncbi:MAG: hypothetical protein ACTSR8_16930 [Promethearchaeota archaeon]